MGLCAWYLSQSLARSAECWVFTRAEDAKRESRQTGKPCVSLSQVALPPEIFRTHLFPGSFFLFTHFHDSRLVILGAQNHAGEENDDLAGSWLRRASVKLYSQHLCCEVCGKSLGTN